MEPVTRLIKWIRDTALGRPAQPEDPRARLDAFQNNLRKGKYSHLRKPLKLIASGQLDGALFVGDIKEALRETSDNPAVRMAGLQALQKIGIGAASAITVAGQLCNSSDDYVRREAIETVETLGHEIVTSGWEIYYQSVADVVPTLANQLSYTGYTPALQKAAHALIDIGTVAFSQHAAPIDSQVVAALSEIDKVAGMADRQPKCYPAILVASQLRQAMARNHYVENPAALPLS